MIENITTKFSSLICVRYIRTYIFFHSFFLFVYVYCIINFCLFVHLRCDICTLLCLFLPFILKYLCVICVFIHKTVFNSLFSCLSILFNLVLYYTYNSYYVLYIIRIRYIQLIYRILAHTEKIKFDRSTTDHCILNYSTERFMQHKLRM